MLKLDYKIEKSAVSVVPLNNIFEDWEHHIDRCRKSYCRLLNDKSAISAQQLRIKYNFICVYEIDYEEVRTAVNVLNRQKE